MPMFYCYDTQRQSYLPQVNVGEEVTDAMHHGIHGLRRRCVDEIMAGDCHLFVQLAQ